MARSELPSPGIAPGLATGHLRSGDLAHRSRTAKAASLSICLVLALFLALLPLPARAESPQITFQVGEDSLTVDLTGILSAEIPDGFPAYISATEDLVALLVRFDEPHASQLREITARHLEEVMTISIDGVEVSHPVVQEPITTGGVIITNVDRTVAETLMAEVNAPRRPPPIITNDQTSRR